jgi:hypothetical protein
MMTGSNPFAELGLTQTIELRWTMRDILAKRWTLTPIDPDRLDALIRMGLAEMHEDEPALTDAGLEALRS